jgi:hypothetical protein
MKSDGKCTSSGTQVLEGVLTSGIALRVLPHTIRLFRASLAFRGGTLRAAGDSAG